MGANQFRAQRTKVVILSRSDDADRCSCHLMEEAWTHFQGQQDNFAGQNSVWKISGQWEKRIYLDCEVGLCSLLLIDG